MKVEMIGSIQNCVEISALYSIRLIDMYNAHLDKKKTIPTYRRTDQPTYIRTYETILLEIARYPK